VRYPTIDSLFIMIGAIIGDIIGSPYEHRNHKSTDFALFSDRSRFTDDTVLTVAVADVILHGKDYAETLVEYFSGYPNAGYGGTFIEQAMTGKLRPYNSWGNGSAMRVGPVGFAFDTAEAVLAEAKRSAEVTHNHPEGIKGPKPLHWPSSWRGKERPKRLSRTKSSSGSAMTCRSHSKRSGRPIVLTYPAKGVSRKH
jgi:hypothetical protein